MMLKYSCGCNHLATKRDPGIINTFTIILIINAWTRTYNSDSIRRKYFVLCEYNEVSDVRENVNDCYYRQWYTNGFRKISVKIN